MSEYEYIVDQRVAETLASYPKLFPTASYHLTSSQKPFPNHREKVQEETEVKIFSVKRLPYSDLTSTLHLPAGNRHFTSNHDLRLERYQYWSVPENQERIILTITCLTYVATWLRRIDKVELIKSNTMGRGWIEHHHKN
jgi:hypothetical protein